MKKRIRIIAVLLLLSATAFGYFHFYKRPPISSNTEEEKVVFQKQGVLVFFDKAGKELSGLHLDIEIAATEYAREKGLMARATLAENQGMLFVFDYVTVQSFWMKDTILPLDMIFVNERNKIVHIAYDAVPFSEELISSEQPAKYVVEVNAGYCRKYHIEIGDQIRWNRTQEEVKQ